MTPSLIGTYTPPAVRTGERVMCLYRDADCVVTGWHPGRIPWPRVRALDSRGGSGLLVNEDLLRAIRTERADALKWWFGVGTKAVWNWRKAFGISHWGTPSSKAAHLATSRKGTAGIMAKEWTEAELDARAERSKRLGLRPPQRPGGRLWTRKDVAKLGTASDAEIAARIGRTVGAVRCKRTGVGIPTFRDRRRRTT
jgi:hypothetical protein